MKKILILYATAGAGHKKAATAIRKAYDESYSRDAQATLVDALDYAPGRFKWMYLRLYLLAVNKLSPLWGFTYHVTNNFYVNLVVARMRRFNNWLNSKALREYIVNIKPDVIISTHFFAGEVVSDLKKKGLIGSRLITVVTDYRLHSWWVSEICDTYVVGGEDARNDLMKWGVDPDRIKILGIPVEPVFSRKLDRKEAEARLGLEKGFFTILVIGGGFGVGPIEEIVRIIDSISKAVQVVVVCGHNEDLVERMKGLAGSMKNKIKVVGFVDNVYEFMDASDLVISKPGGITVSESLAKDLPMIMISPIPGQEAYNADFLIRHSAAFSMKDLKDLKGILENILADPEKLARTKEAIGKIKKPMAAYDIAKLGME